MSISVYAMPQWTKNIKENTSNGLNSAILFFRDIVRENVFVKDFVFEKEFEREGVLDNGFDSVFLRY